MVAHIAKVDAAAKKEKRARRKGPKASLLRLSDKRQQRGPR
jgi:hypothetical protein